MFIVLCGVLALSLAALYYSDVAGVGTLVFLIGNIGGYVSVHRGLGELKDDDVIGMASNWWTLVVPPFVGGILAMAMYLLFLSNIIGGDVFPTFEADAGAPKTFRSLMAQHATTMPAYAKLLFWSFVAGFNQKYVVDIINSVKAKP